MSTAELLPLFPSALHPAIPIAAQILSTLRGLTAPGRGNDLRPEERAALVGVAALLGCERVQSKDLLQSSAQKASSVSPAHFRSALAHARRLLKTVDLPALGASPPKRSSRASSSTTSPTKPDASLASTQQQTDAEETTTPAPNIFNTPRKKYKYSSGVDVSALIRNTPRSNHEPAMSSPLRHSVTPSKRPVSSPRDEAATPTGKTLEAIEEEATAKAGDELRTPSKRVKYGTRPGVDLEKVEVPPVISSARKKREDASAFFALRPGVAGSAPGDLVQDGLGKTPSGRIPFEDGLPEVHTPTFRRKKLEGERKARVRRKRDWTYREGVWARDTSENREVLEKVFAALPSWMETRQGDVSEAVGSLEDVLLGSLAGEM